MTFGTDRFMVTQEHLLLIGRTYIGYNDYMEFGAPEVDPKRPYGDSDVYGDLGEILGVTPEEDDGWDEKTYSQSQRDKMYEVHRQMENVLQILVDNAGVGITTGWYEREKYVGRWAKA